MLILAAALALSDVESSLKQVSDLKLLEPQQSYTMLAGGQSVAGKTEDFAWKRSAEEIESSGVSTGPWDYAVVLYDLLKKKGAELLLVESVELSAASLSSRSRGHAAVAVKDAESGKWRLCDPEKGKILSQGWDSAATTYRTAAGKFWIGFAGPFEERSGDAKAFYAKTLKAVPASVWEKELVRLEFVLEGAQNPRAPGFVEQYSPRFYEKLGVSPKRGVRVALTDGEPGVKNDCQKTDDGWTCAIGRDTGMTSALFAWIERKVLKQ